MRSKLVNFILDCKFFIKKGFIFVNGNVIRDPLFNLKIGDRIQMASLKRYYFYIKLNKKFFDKKIKIMKRRFFDLISNDKPIRNFYS